MTLTDETAARAPAPVSPPADAWSFRSLSRLYWRVAVLAVLVGLFAYVASFVVPPTYAATTRILLRGRDSTVLNSNGAALGSQPGVIDSQLATALADTQAALLANRAIAERIVDELALDEKEEEGNGPIAAAKRGLVGLYVRTRAILAHGFYKSVDDRTAAIDQLQAGLGAKQVEDGYALDVGALWDDPDEAAAIANLAADLLVETSNDRFRAESAAYRDFLQERVAAASDAERAARSALAEYKAANGIVTTPEQDAQVILQTEDDLNVEIRATQAELAAARAEVASLEREFAATSPFVETEQNIRTGRSETDVSTTAPNPAYTQILNQMQSARAEVQSLAARLGALQGALGLAADVEAGTLSDQEARLNELQLDVAIASDTRTQLAEELRLASVNAERSLVEVTRIDQASAPTYPVAPKRYLFLAIGLFVGALVGFVWSFLRVQRQLRSLQPAGGPTPDPAIDLRDAESAEDVGAGRNGVLVAGEPAS
jgi:uncharacterized protein involved in exopolysaccharide biosynthesis